MTKSIVIICFLAFLVVAHAFDGEDSTDTTKKTMETDVGIGIDSIERSSSYCPLHPECYPSKLHCYKTGKCYKYRHYCYCRYGCDYYDPHHYPYYFKGWECVPWKH